MVNNVVLIGRLANSPDLRYSGGGVPICRFTLACDRAFSKENQTDFIRILSFNKIAELAANHLDKGRLVCVTGSIQTGSYEKDGVKYNTFEVVANRITFLDWPKDKPSADEPDDPGFGWDGSDGSDLPF